MPSESAVEALDFGRARFDPARRVLVIDGVPAKLGARAFDLLAALIDGRDRVVPKDELIKRVWPGLVVEDNNLQVQVSALRKLLGPQSVVTVAGRGYRFTLVPRPAADAAAGPDPAVGDRAPATPHNLPAEVNGLIGRADDVADLRAAMSAARLVTVTGFGGTGKTRLSVHAARQRLADFPDGVWFVEFAPLTDPALLPHAIADLLQLEASAGEDLLQTVVRALHQRRTLLVLDNCEHLVRACAELVRVLLRSCAELRILATSREALGVQGEQVYALAPLPLPLPLAGPEPAAVSALAGNPAVRLFIERAEASTGGFRLDPRNAAAVVSICRQLDGMPFALELAAARLRVLSIDQVAAMLTDRFRLLNVGPRGAAPHHQTLRATLDWSYGLLQPREQALLGRLSVFRGGFDLEAAAGICGDGGDGGADAYDVLDDLAQLVQKSLVDFVDQDGKGRYALLETVREYGQETLSAQQWAQVAAAQLRHFVALAEAAEQGLVGPEQGPWLHRLHLEHDNFRAALGFALQTGLAVEACRLCGALGRFWEIRGHYSEGRSWLAKALQLSAGVQGSVLAKALCVSALLAYQQGDFEPALRHSQRAMALSQADGDLRGVASARFVMGVLERERGDSAEARRSFEAVLAIHESLGETVSVLGATAALNLFVTVLRAGDFAEAQQLGERALEISRQSGDGRSLGHTLNMLSYIASLAGEHDRAKDLCTAALAIFEDLGHQRGVTFALHGLGPMELARGRLDEAWSCLLRCLRRSREIGYAINLILSLGGLARVASLQGRPLQAARLLGLCDRMMRETGFVMGRIDRRHYDAAQADLTTALGADGFAQACRQGALLPVDAVIGGD